MIAHCAVRLGISHGCAVLCGVAGTGHDPEVNASRRKLDDSPVDEELRSCIRRFCEELMSALNKYYAFGSCFVDDYT